MTHPTPEPKRYTQKQLIRHRPLRGFAAVLEGVYVREGFALVPCHGEAHSNPHIDHCGVCMGGTWGKIAVRIPGAVEAAACAMLRETRNMRPVPLCSMDLIGALHARNIDTRDL